MLWLIWLTAFTAIFFLTYSLVTLYSRRHRVKSRFGNPDPLSSAALLRTAEPASPVKQWFLDRISSSGEWALKDLDRMSKVRERLIQAGFRKSQAVAVLYGLRVLGAVLLPLPFLLTIAIKGNVTPLNILMAFLLSGAGFFLPYYLLTVRMRQRQNRLDKALPDVLDLFVICMEAGLALNATLNRVADEIRETSQDFFDELQITGTELRTGIPWDEAFDNLGKRTGVASVKSLVGLMIQTEKLGTSIGDALRNHGEFVRTQRMLRAEEKAAKLPLKLIFPLIFCIFPAILIVCVGPGMIYAFKMIVPLAQQAR